MDRFIRIGAVNLFCLGHQLFGCFQTQDFFGLIDFRIIRLHSFNFFPMRKRFFVLHFLFKHKRKRIVTLNIIRIFIQCGSNVTLRMI